MAVQSLHESAVEAARILATAKWFTASPPSAAELTHCLLNLRHSADNFLADNPSQRQVTCSTRGVVVIATVGSNATMYDYCLKIGGEYISSK